MAGTNADRTPFVLRDSYTPKVGTWAKNLCIDRYKPFYCTNSGAAFNCNSMLILQALPSASVDLVITSPPFALTRKKEYGNEPTERYLDWFMPFCVEIRRILKPTGSFVLDIGGAWVPGAPVRSLYHFELAVRLANPKMFYLAQEFYWYNPAKLPTPAEWVAIRRIRVKDAVNMVWWFGKQEFPKADNRKVLRPYSESMRDLIRRGYKARKRPSGHDISDTFQRDNGGAIPPNLLEIANTESNSYYLRRCKELGIKPHPARYPEALIKFFLDFLTDENDVVVDPFCGSNVTGAVCQQAGRRWISSELRTDYLDGSLARFDGGSLIERNAAMKKRKKKVDGPLLFGG
jgi:DNA modification methylase